MCWSQPLVEDRDEDGRFVADGEFLVSGGYRPVPLEAVDAALDSMMSVPRDPRPPEEA
jgi:hypothetical protein